MQHSHDDFGGGTAFFRVNISLPLALLSVIVYLLGAATGGSLFALLRRSYRRSWRSAG